MANKMEDDDDSVSQDAPNIPAQLTKGTGLIGSDDADSSPAPMSDAVKQYLLSKQSALADAQKQSSQNQLYAGLARAGGTLSNALAGNQGKMDETGFNALDKAADAPTQDVIARQQSEASGLDTEKKMRDIASDEASKDPDSDVSKSAQIAFKATFPGVLSDEDLEGMSARSLAEQQKTFITKAKLDEATSNHQMAHETQQARFQTTHDKQQSDQDKKDSLELDNYLGKTWSARSGAAGATQAKINAAEAAEKLIEQAKTQKGGLDSRQIEELAQSTARTLGGGTSASARVEALVPHTFWGKAQSLNEWLTNEPKGADQQAFVDRMADTISREKALAQQQKQSYQTEGLAARSGFRQRNPEQFNSILRQRGLDPDKVDAPQTPQPQGQAPAQQYAPDVVQYAQKHNITPDQANKIKQGRAQSFAMGGMVGGLPASNFAAAQATHVPKQPALHLPGLKKFADGGQVQSQAPSPTIDERIRQYLGFPTGQGSGTFRSYQGGGTVPGQPKVDHNSFSNDTVKAKLSPTEVVLPISVTHAKDPALAAYLFMKNEMSKK